MCLDSRISSSWLEIWVAWLTCRRWCTWSNTSISLLRRSSKWFRSLPTLPLWICRSSILLWLKTLWTRSNAFYLQSGTLNKCSKYAKECLKATSLLSQSLKPSTLLSALPRRTSTHRTPMWKWLKDKKCLIRLEQVNTSSYKWSLIWFRLVSLGVARELVSK